MLEIRYPTKIIKENADIFSENLPRLMLLLIQESFHQFSNWLMLPQFSKKDQRTITIIADQSGF